MELRLSCTNPSIHLISGHLCIYLQKLMFNAVNYQNFKAFCLSHSTHWIYRVRIWHDIERITKYWESLFKYTHTHALVGMITELPLPRNRFYNLGLFINWTDIPGKLEPFLFFECPGLIYWRWLISNINDHMDMLYSISLTIEKVTS